jgi:hypothetical protein
MDISENNIIVTEVKEFGQCARWLQLLRLMSSSDVNLFIFLLEYFTHEFDPPILPLNAASLGRTCPRSGTGQ